MGENGDAPLDYATIQILPSQNRYEAYICREDKQEKLTVGLLQKLLPHLPGLKNLYSKGSNANYKLQPPESRPAWFSKSTLTRFLHIIGSTNFLDTAKGIEGEMSQLEEARKFHLSLYAQVNQDHTQSGENDICNSVDMALTSKQFEVQNSSSDTSKNELLRAMDSRLTALRSEIVAAFNQAVGETCSYKEIRHLAKFSENFGAKDLKNILFMLPELSQQCQIAKPQDDEKSLSTRASFNGSIIKSDGNDEISKLVSSEIPVKYGVSPAKVAQVECQNSTESEESSESSDETHISAERSRALVRSASPRRSASPMRRVQIGRSGSRRAPALTIKSLSYIPAREKTFSQRDVCSDDSEEEGSGHTKKPENHVRLMSVQDAINLFESKQRDQITDVPKKNPLTNSFLGPSKSVLRRWSAGMGESSAQCQSQDASEDPVPATSDSAIDSDNMMRSVRVNLESDTRTGAESINETADGKLERLEESSSSPIDVEEVTDIIHEEEANERSKSSAEWNRQKEMELNQMFKRMMENQSVNRKPQTKARQNLPPEQRGGFYDHYKEKRDQKLRGENAGKRAVNKAKFRATQKILDERKAEMASKNVNNICKKDPPTKTQKSAKNSQKLLKNPSQPANARKETTKPSTTKKVSSKTSPLPATRKSWPSTPSPRTTVTLPATTPGGISSAGTTPMDRKPQSAASVPRLSPKVENSQPQRRNVKATQMDKRGLVGVNEKQQEKLMKGSKTTKTKGATAPEKPFGKVPAKPSLYNKVTKKSSVVPLETKPFLQKGSGITSSVGPVNKIKNPSQLDDSLRNSENYVDLQETDVIVNASALVHEHQDQDVSSADHCDDAIQLETQLNTHQNCDMPDNVDEVAPDFDDGLKNIAESSQCEEESTIPPTAWVDMEEHQDLPDQCDEKTGEITSSASIAPVESASLPVRHSLSQMLQEETSEADINEWGNTENPPAMVYQKDAPKGLKRLLKFARKSKGDANVTGWSSPSVYSEGEDDTEESKSINKKTADNLLWKAALHAKSYGQQKTLSSDGYENRFEFYELPTGQSGSSMFDAQKMQKGSISGAGSTTKGSRSFFSLSAFRGSKPSEMKLRR